MFGVIRNTAIIGLIAYMSPVHDESFDQRLAALRAAPERLASDSMRAAPGLAQDTAKALDTAMALDPASRDALTRKIATLAVEAASGSSLAARTEPPVRR